MVARACPATALTPAVGMSRSCRRCTGHTHGRCTARPLPSKDQGKARDTTLRSGLHPRRVRMIRTQLYVQYSDTVTLSLPVFLCGRRQPWRWISRYDALPSVHCSTYRHRDLFVQNGSEGVMSHQSNRFGRARDRVHHSGITATAFAESDVRLNC